MIYLSERKEDNDMLFDLILFPFRVVFGLARGIIGLVLGILALVFGLIKGIVWIAILGGLISMLSGLLGRRYHGWHHHGW